MRDSTGEDIEERSYGGLTVEQAMQLTGIPEIDAQLRAEWEAE